MPHDPDGDTDESMLGLDQPKDVTGIIGTALTLYGRYPLIFVGVTFVFAAPVDLVLFGAIEGFGDGYDDDTTWFDAANALASFVLLSPLVTGFHVRLVDAIGRGERPTPGDASRATGGAWSGSRSWYRSSAESPCSRPRSSSTR